MHEDVVFFSVGLKNGREIQDGKTLAFAERFNSYIRSIIVPAVIRHGSFQPDISVRGKSSSPSLVRATQVRPPSALMVESMLSSFALSFFQNAVIGEARGSIHRVVTRMNAGPPIHTAPDLPQRHRGAFSREAKTILGLINYLVSIAYAVWVAAWASDSFIGET